MNNVSGGGGSGGVQCSGCCRRVGRSTTTTTSTTTTEHPSIPTYKNEEATEPPGAVPLELGGGGCCSACVWAALRPARKRHAVALDLWTEARATLARNRRHDPFVATTTTTRGSIPLPPTTATTIEALADQSRTLQRLYNELRSDCTAAAQELGHWQMRNRQTDDDRSQHHQLRDEQYQHHQQQQHHHLALGAAGVERSKNAIAHQRLTLQRLGRAILRADTNDDVNNDEEIDKAPDSKVEQVAPMDTPAILPSSGDRDRHQNKSSSSSSGGALEQAIAMAKTHARNLRFQWALEAFRMHRLQVVAVEPQHHHHHPFVRNTHNNTATEERDSGNRTTSPTTTTTTTTNPRPPLPLPRPVGSGIGKIGGLPLPHAGPELYGVLPREELQSALRLVAQLTSVLAQCLRIRLPHPIWLGWRPPSHHTNNTNDATTTNAVAAAATTSSLEPNRDIADFAKNRHDGTVRGGSTFSIHKPSSLLSASTIASALQEQASMLMRDSLFSPPKKSLSNYGSAPPPATTTFSSTSNASSRFANSGAYTNGDSTGSMMNASQVVAQRVRHAVVAVLAEQDDPLCSTYYALSYADSNSNDIYTSNTNNTNYNNSTTTNNRHQDDQEFGIALQLLQNNVVALCIRSGVPVAQLWSGEALLGNLYTLQKFCEIQAI